LELTSPQTNYRLRPSARLPQSPGVSPNDFIPSVGAQHAALGMLNADGRSADSSHVWNNHEPRFVGYGEVDPEKHSKRRDRVEDKKRKEHICMWNGACLKCKNTKKQCNGGKRCKRCHQKGYDCIRTCDSCWSNKKPECDEGVPCKNCQRASTICLRPSASSTRTDDVHLDLTGVHSQPVGTTSSSAQVNNHTILATGRQIKAPTAWNVTFGLPLAPHQTDELDVMRPASDSALLGSQRYSQQSTDVDLRRASTKSSSTKVASESDSLQVPGKQHVSFDSRSEATDDISHFDEAMYYSDQG
jgi:hypothetical protein